MKFLFSDRLNKFLGLKENKGGSESAPSLPYFYDFVEVGLDETHNYVLFEFFTDSHINNKLYEIGFDPDGGSSLGTQLVMPIKKFATMILKCHEPGVCWYNLIILNGSQLEEESNSPSITYNSNTEVLTISSRGLRYNSNLSHEQRKIMADEYNSLTPITKNCIKLKLSYDEALEIVREIKG